MTQRAHASETTGFPGNSWLPAWSPLGSGTRSQPEYDVIALASFKDSRGEVDCTAAQRGTEQALAETLDYFDRVADVAPGPKQSVSKSCGIPPNIGSSPLQCPERHMSDLAVSCHQAFVSFNEDNDLAFEPKNYLFLAVSQLSATGHRSAFLAAVQKGKRMVHRGTPPVYIVTCPRTHMPGALERIL